MAIGGAINQVTQIGAEATAGTSVPAVRRLTSLGVTIGGARDIGKTRPRGQKFASAHPLNREWSEGEVEGTAAYNELQYPFCSILQNATPTALEITRVNSTAYALGVITTGSAFYHKVTTAGTTGGAPPTWNTTVGGTTTDGTVTWTNIGSTTTPLRQWLFQPDTFAKDVVKTYTVENVDTTRSRAHKAVNMMFGEFSIESSRSGEVEAGGSVFGKNLTRNVVPTTAGLVVAQPVVVMPSHVNVYFDTTAAGLGTTKMDANFGYKWELGGDRFQQAWVHDRSLGSWKEYVEGEPDATLEITIAEDTLADTMLANLSTGDRAFIRFEAIGPLIIPGSGANGVKYTLEIDMACQVADAEETDEEDGAYVITLPFEAEHDATWGRAMQARLINSNTAL